MTNEAVKQNVANKESWCRLLYVILFAMVLYIVMMLLGLVVVVQLIYAFATGTGNDDIKQFGRHLAQYINQIVLFLTYNDNRRPYPFNPLYDESDDELDEQEEQESAYNSAEQSGEAPQQLDDTTDKDNPAR